MRKAFLPTALALALLFAAAPVPAQEGAAAEVPETVIAAETIAETAAETIAETAAETTAETAAGAQSPVDEVFSGEGADVVADSSGSRLGLFEGSRPLAFSGSLVSTAGAFAGWSVPAPLTLNPVPPPLFLGTRDSLAWLIAPDVGGFGLSLTNSLRFDASPDAASRVHGSLSLSAPGYALSVTELFFDYEIAGRVFLRVGKQSLDWGSESVYRPGGLAAGTARYLSLKAHVPFLSHGITLLGLGDPGAAADGVIPWGLAGKLDLAFWKLELSTAGKYLSAVPGSPAAPWRLETSTVLKTSLFGIDLFGEHYGILGGPSSPGDFESSFLAGLFWDSSSPKISVRLGYCSDDLALPGGAEHLVTAAAAWSAPGRLHLVTGFQWLHSLADGSGRLIPGLSLEPLDRFNLTVGALAVYGGEDSYYGEPVVPSSLPAASGISLATPLYAALFAKLTFSLEY